MRRTATSRPTPARRCTSRSARSTTRGRSEQAGLVPPGFYVDDIAVDGTTISDGSTLVGWQSAGELHPSPVAGWTVQLVAYDGSGNAWYHELELDSSFHGSMTQAEIEAAFGSTSPATVAAIVMQDDPTESIRDQAYYTLTVNGAVMPGGH